MDGNKDADAIRGKKKNTSQNIYNGIKKTFKIFR
jgi:hypothetical protein